MDTNSEFSSPLLCLQRFVIVVMSVYNNIYSINDLTVFLIA